MPNFTHWFTSYKWYKILLFVVLLGLVAWMLSGKRPSDGVGDQTPATAAYLESVSEEPIAADYAWSGRSDEPKYLTLPTINAEGFIESVGLGKSQEIKVPSNIHTVGWFNQSAKPGRSGVSVIDGHVDGVTKPGIFRRLAELKPGDQFTVRLGDNSVKTFQVIEVVTVDTEAALSTLFSQIPGINSQLNLITCGGIFNKQSKTYDKRVIVSSKPI